MIANLTTPLIGIVSTTAIGRLGDATLLGGVAMASVIFDCMFWLFAFLRMGTVAFTAQSLGAGETGELRAHLARGLVVAAIVGALLSRCCWCSCSTWASRAPPARPWWRKAPGCCSAWSSRGT
jgi:Na+-driven multidrug efflux pump